MSIKSTQPLKGFNDHYPQQKAFQEYLFAQARESARLFGFQEYDGPLVEPVELYVGKTSRELLEEQAFTLTDKNGELLMLRPEMTPTLARMVAAQSQELNLPVRLHNIGLRYRYEAPQRGRDREFYQLDFDILGADSALADIEILRLIVDFFSKLGANSSHYRIHVNSREVLNSHLLTLGISHESLPRIILCIDKRSKVSPSEFEKLLLETGITQSQCVAITNLLSDPSAYAESFTEILDLARAYGIEKYIHVSPDIVRGLDYYTGLVFEVIAESDSLRRSLLGGGRYANLVEKFGVTPISGIGCATSDTILKEFLTEYKLLPQNLLQPSHVLVTIFSQETTEASIQATQAFREAGITSQLYPSYEKLQKQLRYAHKAGIGYVVVIGPDEIAHGHVMLKTMNSGEQHTLSLDEAINHIRSHI